MSTTKPFTLTDFFASCVRPMATSLGPACSLCTSTAHLNLSQEAKKSIRILSCHHIFHIACLTDHLWENNTCPTCKKLLYTQDPPSTATKPTTPIAFSASGVKYMKAALGPECYLCKGKGGVLGEDEQGAVRIVSCAHVFHKNCLKYWALLEKNCPTCEKILYTEDTATFLPGLDLEEYLAI